MTDAAEREGSASVHFSRFFALRRLLLGGLTSVGHEDLQPGVLQQVASGEHSSDFAEHPFAVQTLGIGQHLFNKRGRLKTPK